MRFPRIACALFVVASAAFSSAAQSQTPADAQPPPPPEPPGAAPMPPTPESKPTPPEETPSVPPAEAPNAPPSEIAKPQEEESPEPGAPRLHIEADRPGVRLLRIDQAISNGLGEAILVRTVCVAPCDQVVDGRRGQTFFLGAEGMVPSRGFALARIGGDVTARVDGGSMAARQVGYLFAAFGGTGVIGGSIMLGVGYSAGGKSFSSEGKVQEGTSAALTTGGLVTLCVGAAVLATGITLVLTSKTSLSLVQAGSKSAGVKLEMGRLVF
jgi:hypothetical protein